MIRRARPLLWALLGFALSWPGCCGECVVGFDRRCPEVLGDLPPDLPDRFLAWAYGGHAGFEGTLPRPVTILFQPMPGISEGYVQTECAPGSDPDSCLTLSRFCVNERGHDSAYGVLCYRTLDEANLKSRDDPTYLIAVPGDSLVRTSNRAQSRITTAPTQYDTLLASLHDDAPGDPPTRTPDTTPLVAWNWDRYPKAQQAVALITDAEGVLMAGVLTKSTTWAYGASAHRIIQAAQPLQSGHTYTLTTWLLSGEYWALAVDQTTFMPR